MSNGTSEITARSTPGEVRGDQRRLAAVAAEQLDHGDPLVRAGARAQVVDELHAAGDRGREADAVVGAVDVVVHRLRDRDHRDALVVHAERVRERVVAADRDQHVDPERLDHAQGVIGEVERPVAVDPVREVGGDVAAAGRGSGSCATCAGTCRPVRSIVRTTFGSSGRKQLVPATRGRPGRTRAAPPSRAAGRSPRAPRARRG